MNTLARFLPATPGPHRPLLRRLADDIGLTVIVCILIAVLITLVNGRTWELYDQMVYSICVGLVGLVVLDGLRFTLLDDPVRRRRWLVPCLVALVAMAPLAHLSGISLGSLILGRPLPNFAEYPNDHGQKGMIGLTFLAISAMALLILNRERVERIKLERTEAKARAETIERQALQAQLRLLQAQIEPHMLFNTLANLQGLIAIDPQQASRMLDHLIQYLRATLSATRAETTTLAQEFEAAEAYLGLMAVRMGPRLAYHCILPAELRSARLPAMLLQPLVENAIIHGLEPKIEGGTVTVEASARAGLLEICVSDTGLGLDDTQTAAKGTGVGVTTTRERLQVLYGERAALTLIPAQPHGVLARLTLPLETA
ncbi:histidine kinase [Telluria mixta]|uniref:Histidine kinase n=1 Tax=Telluria mixta TaxID=34071 RepID=A0ABT2C943_9BURK|nr:histidine kinase [Telluria mixta]MCS0633918.1 histidine kinase [Telluria mixta]WEM95532.1 histidine kinase [Telluria mixta]